MKPRNFYVEKNEIKSGQQHDTLIAELNNSFCIAIYWPAENKALMGHCAPNFPKNYNEDIKEMIFSLLRKLSCKKEQKKELKVYLAFDKKLSEELIASVLNNLKNEQLEFMQLESFKHDIRKVFFRCLDGTTSLEIEKDDIEDSKK